MRIATLMLVLFAPLGISRADDKQADDLKKLQGVWEVKAMVYGGDKLTESEWVHKKWEFKGDKVFIEMKGSTSEFKLEIDPSKTIPHIDLSTTNPKLGFIGLYKLDGDNLAVCVNAGRETRPSSLESTRKDVFIQITLKRKK